MAVVSRGFDGFLAIADDAARQAMRALARAGVVSGETGAAATGAVLAVARRGDRDAVAALGPRPDDTVVLLSTEGATDPAAYESIVGRRPEDVGSSGDGARDS